MGGIILATFSPNVTCVNFRSALPPHLCTINRKNFFSYSETKVYMKNTLLFALLLGALTATAQVAPTANITLDGAKKVAAAAAAYAQANQSPGGTIAIVDLSGQLIYLERLDGSFPASASVAYEKARTAVLFRFESKKLEDAINGGRNALITVGYTFLQGGVPLEYGGQIVGAIGISGAKSADQDREVALAGAAALKN